MEGASKLVLRQVQKTSVPRNRVECGNASLAPRPRTFPFDVLLLRPAEARQLRWCDFKMFFGSLSTRHEKVCGIVNIRETQMCRMAGHAAQQHVLLECPGICQLVNTLKSSIPDHRLHAAIWKFTAAQHFAPFPATTPQPWHVTSTIHAPRTPRRWSYRSSASISRFTTNDAEVGGPPKGPLKDTSQKGRFQSIKTSSPKKLQTVSVHSQSSRLLSLQSKTTESPTTSPLQPPRCNGKGRRRATELCPHRLASRSVTFITQ